MIRTTYHNIYLKEKEDEEQIISKHFSVEENLTSNLAERERLKNMPQSSMSFGPQAQMKPSLNRNSDNLTVIKETKRDQSTGDSLDFASLSSNDVSLKGFSGTGTVIEKK